MTRDEILEDLPSAAELRAARSACNLTLGVRRNAIASRLAWHRSADSSAAGLFAHVGEPAIREVLALEELERALTVAIDVNASIREAVDGRAEARLRIVHTKAEV